MIKNAPNRIDTIQKFYIFGENATTILNYTNFKQDVVNYMRPLIYTHNFKVYEERSGVWDLLIWLENDKCKILISAISLYPRQVVSFYFYRKNCGDYFNSSLPQRLFIYYGIDENEYNQYLVGLNNTICNPDDDEFSGYRKSLIINAKLLTKYYLPILNECYE